MPGHYTRLLVISLLFRTFAVQANPVDSALSAPAIYEEVKERLDRTKSEKAMILGEEFAANWNNGTFSTAAKENLESILFVMKEKNLPAIPYLVNLIHLVNRARGGNSAKIESLLPFLKQNIDEVSPADFNNAVIRLNDFFEYHTIYYSRYYRLYVSSDDYTFEYIPGAGAGGDFLAEADKGADATGFLETTGLTQDESTGSENDDGWGNTANDGTVNATDDPWGNQAVDTWGDTDSNSDTADTWSSGGWGDSGGWDDTGGFSSTGIDQGNAGNGLNYSGAIASAELLPPEKGLLARFGGTDLIFVTPYDSFLISSTAGAWMVNEKIFLGNGGSFDWTKAGFDTGSVSTQFDKYFLNVEHPEIKAENVKLQYPDMLEEPVEGIFDYLSTRPDRTGKMIYPRFTAYYNGNNIKFADDPTLKLNGGFSITGNSISTSSLTPGNTILNLDDGRHKLTAIGNRFDLRDSSLYSANTSITIYQGVDSIYHPAVRLMYDLGNRELLAEKSDGKYHQTPFLASYFKMEVEADAIQWTLDSDSLDIFISRARNIVPASFTSYDHFNPESLKSLSDPFRFNPLLLAVNYSRKIGSVEFNTDDLANSAKLNPVSVRAGMLALLKYNFISYDQNSGWVTLKEKAFHFAESNKGMKDFDQLVISSISGTPKNATVDLVNNELNIRGINKFYISEVLDVFILPDSNEITVLGNRDLKFDGRLLAGNFEFVGREFLFKYDSFYVDLTYIDSIRFYIDDPETGQKRPVDNKLVSADSTMAEDTVGVSGGMNKTTGRLFINLPDNKSGKKDYPGYPTFDAAQGAVVYFNSKEILKGAYNQSVYFVIPPFKIDSLSDSDPSTIGFDGKFYSGGLLPPFDETLYVMPDNSLGFDHDIGPEGYNLYGGSGKIFNHLRVDKNGITAQGDIQYLTSTLSSDALTFYLDSLTGQGRNFRMEEGELNGGSFPDASIPSFRMSWLPKKDSMYIYNIDKPFTLYKGTATLEGALNVSRKGAFGMGELVTRNSVTNSNEFFFNQTRFDARHAHLDIQSNDPDKPILSGEDVRLKFNLEENYADIGPEVEGMAAINFPYAQFKTSIPTMRWDLNNRKVEMQKPENIDIGSSYFYATREDLDSLVFNATSATYNIDNFQLLIKGIPYINVADAKITPEGNQVLVLENARIGTLKNATIVIDTLDEYHSLYNGTIDIISRNEFEGVATYRFVNAVNDTFAIAIDQFELVPEKTKGREQVLHTMASGFINEEDGVVISPGMAYRGKAIMYAPDPAFALDGFIKLQYRPNPQKEIWIKYSTTETSTQEVMIDFNRARTEDDQSLVAGIHYDEDDTLYATFANEKKNLTDADFFLPGGILYYDPDSTSYRIEDTMKTSGHSYQGRIFNLNVNTNDLEFEGPVNFNVLSSGIQIESAGIGRGNAVANEYSMDAFITLNYNIPLQASMSMATQVFNAAEQLQLPPGYDDDPGLLYKVSELIGEKPTEEYVQKSLQEYVPLVTISPRLEKTFALSRVLMKYDKRYKAWYSTGDIGISNMGSQDLNIAVEGYLEIKKAENGDIVNLYLKLSPDAWYYFNFEENRLLTVSSNGEFSDIIESKSGALKANFGEYFFLKGDGSDVNGFIDSFRQNYLGAESQNEPVIPELPKEEGTQIEEKTDEVITPDETENKEEDDDGF